MKTYRVEGIHVEKAVNLNKAVEETLNEKDALGWGFVSSFGCEPSGYDISLIFKKKRLNSRPRSKAKK